MFCIALHLSTFTKHLLGSNSLTLLHNGLVIRIQITKMFASIRQIFLRFFIFISAGSDFQWKLQVKVNSSVYYSFKYIQHSY